MSREIEFRAWDNKAKVMFPVHGMYFCKITNQLDYISGVDIHDKDSDYHGNVTYGGSIHKKTGSPGGPQRPKFELMQYTGLKDKNGVKIFEKDIVESNWGYRFPIFYEDGCYKTDSEDFEVINENQINYYSLKVIGNIYENPNLLEETK